MYSAPIEFHKIWIEQCSVTEDIRENFGSNSALDYLIGQKLFAFLHASERDPLFAADVPAFIGEIRRLFTTKELADYFSGSIVGELAQLVAALVTFVVVFNRIQDLGILLRRGN